MKTRVVGGIVCCYLWEVVMTMMSSLSLTRPCGASAKPYRDCILGGGGGRGAPRWMNEWERSSLHICHLGLFCLGCHMLLRVWWVHMEKTGRHVSASRSGQRLQTGEEIRWATGYAFYSPCIGHIIGRGFV